MFSKLLPFEEQKSIFMDNVSASLSSKNCMKKFAKKKDGQRHATKYK
jgi:hypothetical protein